MHETQQAAKGHRVDDTRATFTSRRRADNGTAGSNFDRDAAEAACAEKVVAAGITLQSFRNMSRPLTKRADALQRGEPPPPHVRPRHSRVTRITF
jgi:hypothetical protein